MSALNGNAASTIAEAIRELDGDAADMAIRQGRLLAAKDTDDDVLEAVRRSVVIEPESFDFDAEQPEPDFVIDRLIERGTVNVCSGDTGAAKSIHWMDAAVSVVHGSEWMGRNIPNKARVLYLDEENPQRIVHSRLPALGMSNDDLERFRYFRRKGIQLGDEQGQWVGWLREECEDFGPDLIVIDTAMAATRVDVNDNDAVTALYSTVLRPVVEAYDLAVVILHHERKPGSQEKRNAGFAMMGARQWAGQADVHMTLTAAGEYTETPRDDGDVDTHKEFRFSIEKGRDGASSRPERTTVRSVKASKSYRLLSMVVEWGGRIEANTVEGDFADKILRVVMEDPAARWTRKDVASVVGEEKPGDPGGSFRRAWDGLEDRGLLERDGNGRRLTDDGRKAAAALPVEF
jgi:hypothetical protein